MYALDLSYKNIFILVLFIVVADLVVASAGDDRKISLWHKNGQTVGVIPLRGSVLGDDIEVTS